MDDKELLAADVRRWQAEGRWIDRGRWTKARNGVWEYRPTRPEIAAKCKLLRSRPRRHGAHVRAPRGGEHAVPTTAGV